MKLFFLRHGLAGERSKWKGDDAMRPLTKKGREKIKRTASTLNELKLGVDVIITSPLARAEQTAAIVAKKLDCRIIEDARLAHGFNLRCLRDILYDHPNAETILLVGHEPEFSQVVGGLTGGGCIELKKGGLALVEMPAASSRRGKLVWLLPPRVLVR